MYSSRTFDKQRDRNSLSALSAQAADSCFGSIVSSLGQSTAAADVETLVSVELGTQLRTHLSHPPKACTPQRDLPLLGRLNGPSVVPTRIVQMPKTYRQAVRLCWAMRRVAYMTQRQLAAEAELRYQFVSDYLNPDDDPKRRDLPAEKVAAFEHVVGNCLVSQWLAARSQLTVLEEQIANKEAA